MGISAPWPSAPWLALLATLVTWIDSPWTIIDSLAESVPALDIQAATGLLAIVVLLVRHELVLPQGILAGAGFDAQPRTQAVADAACLRDQNCGGVSRCLASRRSIVKASRSSCFCKATV